MIIKFLSILLFISTALVGGSYWSETVYTIAPKETLNTRLKLLNINTEVLTALNIPETFGGKELSKSKIEAQLNTNFTNFWNIFCKQFEASNKEAFEKNKVQIKKEFDEQFNQIKPQIIDFLLLEPETKKEQ